MEITARSARIFGVRLTNVAARIPELGGRDTRLRIQGEVQGPLPDVVRYLAASPIDEKLGYLFTGTRGAGTVRGDLRLDIPLSRQPARPTEVAGSVVFNGNDLDLRGEIPPLNRLVGRLEFTEKSLRIAGATAEGFGGTTRLDIATRNDGTIEINAAGTATPAGLRRATTLAPLQRLLERAQGTTRYTVAVTVRSGRPDMRIESDLVGWALDAPPPLHKAAGETLPLAVQFANTDATHDSLRITVGNIASARFERAFDAAGEARVERGTIGIGNTGGEAPPLPDSGVLALVNLERLDVDRWHAFFETLEAARRYYHRHRQCRASAGRLARQRRADAHRPAGARARRLRQAARQRGGRRLAHWRCAVAGQRRVRPGQRPVHVAPGARRPARHRARAPDAPVDSGYAERAADRTARHLDQHADRSARARHRRRRVRARQGAARQARTAGAQPAHRPDRAAHAPGSCRSSRSPIPTPA